MSSSVSLRVGIAISSVVIFTLASCDRRRAEKQDTTSFHPPTTSHRVSLNDGGVSIDPHARSTTPEEAAGAQYLCSACYKTVSQAHVHVIPWFNDSTQDYVTAFRCDDDWLTSLDETRKHFLANLGHAEDRDKFVAFFQRHNVVGLKSSDAAQLKSDGLEILNKLQKTQLVLSP